MSKKVLFPPRGFICLTQYDTLNPSPIYVRYADISAIAPVKLVRYDRRGGHVDGYIKGAQIQYGTAVVSVTETAEQVIEVIKEAAGE